MPTSILRSAPSEDIAFFYQATRSLCSSLTPETAMREFYNCIARHLPLRMFVLGSMVPPFVEACVVAKVTSDSIASLFQKYIVPQDHIAMGKALDVNNPRKYRGHLVTSSDDPFLRYLKMAPETEASVPLFFLRLARENVTIGSAIFMGTRVYTKQEVNLMMGLEGPLCIALSNILRHRELELLKDDILEDNERLRRRLKGLGDVEVIGANRGLAQVMETVRQVAPVDVPVLVQGETGSGKEVIARALHDMSPRRAKPFVAVNCGALPPSMIESELFGHEKGAFTGANSTHKGFFERANGGTLLLDEVGELPLEAQTRLLRVLETREIERIGGNSPIKIDIRLIASTHRDLGSMAVSGTFREDLFYRLNVVNIVMPPLRERQEDIPLLVRHLLKRSATRFGVTVPPPAPGEVERLLAWHWPGNVRELQNVLEAALVCSQNGMLRFWGGRDPVVPKPISRAAAAPPAFSTNSAASTQAPSSSLTSRYGMDAYAVPDTFTNPDAYAPPASYQEQQKAYFENLIRRCKGRISGPFGAATLAELNPSTFRFKCRQMGIDWKKVGGR